ncbi:MAG: FxsA family protein [Candidatus Puniceispirillaceae bacterium]
MSAFIFVGGEIGGLMTILGVFVTSIVGLTLLKSQGSAVMVRVQNDLAQGNPNVDLIADGVALIMGSILMLLPGFVTDIIGFLLFMPGLRRVVGTWILHHFINNTQFKKFTHFSGGAAFKEPASHSFDNGDDIIEGDVTEHTTKNNKLNNHR